MGGGGDAKGNGSRKGNAGRRRAQTGHSDGEGEGPKQGLIMKYASKKVLGNL